MTVLEPATHRNTAQPLVGRVGRWYWSVVTVLLLLHGSLVWITRTPAVSPNANDDAQYLLLARSVRSLHYQDQHVLGMPVHSQYPPAYPVMLAAWSLVAGERLQSALIFSMLLAVGGLLLATDLARRLVGPVGSLALLAALSVNPALIAFAGRTVSEQPYLTVSIAALWATVALPESRRRTWLIGCLAIVAALTRTIGISLVAGVGIAWLLERRYRRVLAWGLAAALTVGCWLVWTWLAPHQFADRSYAAVAAQSISIPHRGLLAVMLHRAKLTISIYLFRSLPAAVQVPTIRGTVADNLVAVTAIVALTASGLWGLRRRREFLWYLIFYVGVLWIWPFKFTRFVIPITPVVLTIMLVGCYTLWGRRILGPVSALILCLPLTGKGITKDISRVRHAIDCPASRATRSTECFSEAQLSFFAAARYVRDHTPPDAVVLTIKEATFYYYSDRQVYHPTLAVKLGSPDLVGFLRRKGIRYVFVSGMVGGANIVRHLDPVCSQFELVASWPARTFLYRLRDPADAITGTPACPSMDKLVPRRAAAKD